MATFKLWSPPGNKNAFKALIAARYVGAKIDVPPMEMGKTNKTPEFLKLNPFGKVLVPTNRCIHRFVCSNNRS